jgi:hypothetical protein
MKRELTPKMIEELKMHWDSYFADEYEPEDRPEAREKWIKELCWFDIDYILGDPEDYNQE